MEKVSSLRIATDKSNIFLQKTVDWNKRFRVLWVVTEIFKLDRIHLVNTLRNELLAANTLVYLFGRLIKRVDFFYFLVSILSTKFIEVKIIVPIFSIVR